jgi:hypothetical protein
VSDERDSVVPDEDLVEKEAPAATTTEYLEFVGQEPYGTEFYGQTGTHTVTKAHMKEHHDVDLGTKEVVWKRGPNGRFLVPVADITPEAAEVLSNDPLFRRVTL